MSSSHWKSLTLSLLLGSAAHAAPPPEVTARMRASFQSLMAVQPWLATPQGFADPARAGEIARHLEVIAGLRHAFPKHVTAEPGVSAISSLFGQYMREAQRHFASGSKEASRTQMVRVTSLCFSCHTRLKSEKDFADLGHQVEALPLRPLEKAEYLAATRQFDKALEAYAVVLALAPHDERSYLDYARALRHAVGVQVSVKDDPLATLALLEPLAARKDLPRHTVKLVKDWLEDARAWKKDPFEPGAATGEQLVAKAQALVQSSGAARSVLSFDPDDIPLLRASNYLHQALAKGVSAARRGDALYLLGVTASALQDPLLWELDGLYFEACVREFPHSELGRRCFQRFSDRLYLGYTGSSGTHVPVEELQRLGALRALAK